LYKPTTSSWDFVTVSIQSLADITASSFYAKMNSIKYELSNTVAWIWVWVLEIILPRAPTRWMILEVGADLKDFLVQNMNTKLQASFWPTWVYLTNSDSTYWADLLLEWIYSNLDAQWIKLKMKNLVYKCWLTFNKTILLRMFPVKTENITNLQVTIAMKGPDQSALAYNTLSHVAISQTQLQYQL